MRLSKPILYASLIFFCFLAISYVQLQAQGTETAETEEAAETDEAVETKELGLKFAGALEFSDEGTLFVGDNYSGSIYAFDLAVDSGPDEVIPVTLNNIDVRIADVLGVGPSAVEINDMAVHPISREIFISVSRLGGLTSQPAIIKVTQDSQIEMLDLTSYSFTNQELTHYPDQETTFRPRGVTGVPDATDIAKASRLLSSVAIMDMLYHEGELFVSGVAYDDFLSSLRRIPYPFDGEQSAASIEMYHIAHNQYETRAPIRAMSIQEIDGQMQLVAAYTCSPLVLIPLDEIVDGAKIAANTIADVGNGQPLDMIPYTLMGQDMLFLTNNSRSPQVISLDGLNGAQVVTEVDFEEGGKMDLNPVMPFGPVGKTVMFDGASLHMALLSDSHFVSLTRETVTGSLNLDSNATMFPNTYHNMIAEFDFPQYYEDKE